MASWTDWKLNDIIYGIVLPVIVAFLIIILPTEIRPIIYDFNPTLVSILVDGFGEGLLVMGIPLFAGLIWNKWAGGATGFLLGSIYALFVNDTFAAYGLFTPADQIGDIANLGLVVCAMLTGYIAGSLNRESYSFRRMLICALVAGLIGGLFLLWTQLISPFGMVTDIPYAAFLTFLPRVIYGVLIPIFVTVFGWFGMTPRHMG